MRPRKFFKSCAHAPVKHSARAPNSSAHAPNREDLKIQDAPGILKQFSIRLDALEVNLEATDNARYAENMEWEGRFQELQDRVEHHARHVKGIDWESKFQELQDRVELLSLAVVNTPIGENTAFKVRKALLECKHTGSVGEYCQAFFALMLDISDMFAVIRLFFFMEGLKPWAHTELNRRRVNNLNEAIIAAESISDYNSEPQRPLQRGNPSRSNGDKKPGIKCQTKVGAVKAIGRQTLPPNRRVELGSKPSLTLAPAEKHPPTEKQTDAQDYEEEDVVGAFPQWCNAMTTQVGNPEECLTREKPKDMPPKKKGDIPGKGLMYVGIKVNGKAIRAKIESNARKRVRTGEGYQLCRTASSGDNEIYFNQDWPIRRNDQLFGSHNDDFKPILGLVFLRDTKTTVMTCTNSLAMLGNKLCVILTISPRVGERYISTLQLKKGLKRDKITYLAMLQWDEIEEVSGPLPKEAKVILNDFEADSRVAINIEKKIRKALTRDPIAQQLLKLIESGKTRQFWQEDGLLMTKGRRVYIPRVDDLRRTLIRECHDTLWANHAGGERTLALLKQGKSAFEIVNGQQPLLPHTVNVPNARKSPRAISFSEEWRQNIDLAHPYLEKAARRMKKHADKNKISQEFNVGNKVMIKLLPQDCKFLRGRDSCLLQKYERPLTIVKKIGKMAYKVDSPHWWSHQLHPIFHVSVLKPFYEDIADPSRGQIRRQGLKPKAAGKRVVEAILNDRVITASRKRHQEYLVKWQGYMEEENTWE
ncbi:hypothetical protein RJ639_033976 [Escallonia herrerae]|uniref:Chromo domain-containing protein n=1 Tax=Escallonia herrerae TaxID=1293975 RepID=A0AA88WWJ6_9ASTE|nr:hypothetical protein RJ639_033976 [Escallonia herrerae]